VLAVLNGDARDLGQLRRDALQEHPQTVSAAGVDGVRGQLGAVGGAGAGVGEFSGGVEDAPVDAPELVECLGAAVTGLRETGLQGAVGLLDAVLVRSARGVASSTRMLDARVWWPTWRPRRRAQGPGSHR